jgi:oligopeptide transport system permease protein
VCLLFAYVLTGWIGTAGRVRTQFYRFKNQEYVMAARTLGAKDSRIIWKHIFPNTLGTIITSSALAIPGVILSESMLSYLGIINLGSSTTTSLGTLLSEAQGIWTLYPHLMIVPALVISLLMVCFNLFGNGLRDAFNPALRGVEE